MWTIEVYILISTSKGQSSVAVVVKTEFRDMACEIQVISDNQIEPLVPIFFVDNEYILGNTSRGQSSL